MERASTRFSLHLTAQERQAVKEKSDEEHCSEAYVIRMLIRQYLPEYARIMNGRIR